VTSAVVNIVARATAFSSTAIQTLEVGTGSTAFVPRFIPGSPTDALWDGHLYRFDLFNEFVAGVDLDKNGNLDGVFLVDKDGDIITEDDKGAFHKQKNNAPAVPVWDAGVQLGAMPAANRKIYTALWDDPNSKWKTIAWPTWDGTGSPPADFASVRDLLGIDGTNPDACAQIKTAMATPIPTAYLSSTSTFDRDHCAKAIIDFVRGYNILNELTTTTSVTVNRARMLGDIFHSSPVVVDPPVDQFICNLGLHAQCVSTLYQYDTNQPVASTASAPRPSPRTRSTGRTTRPGSASCSSARTTE
jgi:type IV pilus assembly protein PilY1